MFFQLFGVEYYHRIIQKGAPIEKRIVGRTEYVSLPEFNFFNIDAKIDTGAYGCSIHCSDIIHNEDNTVHFKLLDKSHPDYSSQHIVMPIHKIKKVKSSNGKTEERIFIKTKISLFDKSYVAELSLTDRESMTYPMLIGRKFLQGHFIVDVALEYQSPIKEN